PSRALLAGGVSGPRRGRQNCLMRFRRGATLDPSQVEDRRGGGMLGLPGGGLTVGGGGLGLVGILIYVLISVLSNGGLGSLGNLDGSTVSQAPPGQVLSDCRTGADANAREDCRILADINSIQRFWEGALPSYVPAKTVFFTGSTPTGCGTASTQ